MQHIVVKSVRRTSFEKYLRQFDSIWNETQVCCLSLNVGIDDMKPESCIAFFEVRITFAI